MGGQRRVGCRPPRGEKIGEIRWLHNPRASPARRSERSGRRKVGRLVEGRKERTRSRGRRRGKRGASSLGPRAPRKLQSAPRRRESPALAGHGARRVGLFWRGGWVGWGGLGWVWWVGRGGVVTHGPRATGVAGWRWLVGCVWWVGWRWTVVPWVPCCCSFGVLDAWALIQREGQEEKEGRGKREEFLKTRRGGWRQQRGPTCRRPQATSA